MRELPGIICYHPDHPESSEAVTAQQCVSAACVSLRNTPCVWRRASVYKCPILSSLFLCHTPGPTQSFTSLFSRLLTFTCDSSPHILSHLVPTMLMRVFTFWLLFLALMVAIFRYQTYPASHLPRNSLPFPLDFQKKIEVMFV